MSAITLLLALLGIASFAVFFYFLRFKASTKQTDRDNRIPWHKILEEEIMGISHVHKPVFGIQFHPESFLTPRGNKIISNFLNLY